MEKTVAIKTAFILILLCAALLAVAGAFSGAVGAVTAQAESDPYYGMNDSSVEIDVDENKVLHIKESLRIGFLKNVSQITRRVPATVNSYKNKNGKLVRGGKFLATVSNVKSRIDGAEAQSGVDKGSVYYTVEVTNPEGDFKLWNEAEGERFYTLDLEYDYYLSDDGAGKNAFAFTPFIYSQTWFYHNDDRNDVAKLNVTVNMPKPFGDGLARVYGDGGDITEAAGLEIIGNSVKFSITFKDISEKQLRIALDDNYFLTHVTFYPMYWLFAGLVLIIMLICIILTVIFRGKRPLSPVEVEPPVINPMHYSAYWNGYPQRKDVATIILYWARLGCIKITKDGKKDLVLTKLKPLPDNCNFAEKQYFNELFRYGAVYRSKDTRGFKNRIRKDRLRFAVNALVEESEKPTPFVPQVERTKKFVNALAVIGIAAMFIYFIMLNADMGSMLGIPLFLGLSLIFIVKLSPIFSGLDNLKQRNAARFLKVVSVMLFALVPVGLFIGAMLYMVYMPQYDYFHFTEISVAWLAICILVLPAFIKRRTDKAQKLYGRMLGFKRFIQLADLPKMELLLKDNPDYFYDVLPYCMVMGLSKKIDKQMQYLGVAVPDWADGFNPAKFAQELFYSVDHAIIVSRKKGNAPQNIL